MIGVFDSGFGGLTVLSVLLDELPEYDYVYLGDSARAPYGGHSKDIILKFTRQGVQFLFDQGARLIILACNSASSNALRELQEEFIRKPGVKDRNILGVVFPIAEEVARLDAHKIALIGTQATMASEVYETEISKIAKNVSFLKQACPLLVPLIEEGWAHKMETRRILKSYLRPLKSEHPDVLVPACTHYPILHNEIQKIMGKRIHVLDTPKIIAKSLHDYLSRHAEIESLLKKTGKRQFFSTDPGARFQDVAKTFFKHPLPQVEYAILPA